MNIYTKLQLATLILQIFCFVYGIIKDVSSNNVLLVQGVCVVLVITFGWLSRRKNISGGKKNV
jgi:hypothetical protein